MARPDPALDFRGCSTRWHTLRPMVGIGGAAGRGRAANRLQPCRPDSKAAVRLVPVPDCPRERRSPKSLPTRRKRRPVSFSERLPQRVRVACWGACSTQQPIRLQTPHPPRNHTPAPASASSRPTRGTATSRHTPTAARRRLGAPAGCRGGRSQGAFLLQIFSSLPCWRSGFP